MFSCLIIEEDRRQGTIYKGPQCNLTVIAQVIRSFLSDLRGRWNQFLKKKSNFPLKNKFGDIFLVLPGMADLR